MMIDDDWWWSISLLGQIKKEKGQELILKTAEKDLRNLFKQQTEGNDLKNIIEGMHANMASLEQAEGCDYPCIHRVRGLSIFMFSITNSSSLITVDTFLLVHHS